MTPPQKKKKVKERKTEGQKETMKENARVRPFREKNTSSSDPGHGAKKIKAKKTIRRTAV